MTLDQLKILVTIAETGSVLAAAKALYRTQPTISVSVKNLEEELSIQLLDRSSYRARLTIQGEQLYRKAKMILEQVDEFSTLAEYLSVGHEAELHLAIEASCPMSMVLKILQSSERNYPQTHFNLQVENIWGALEKLQDGEVDLAISPWFQDIQNLESLPLTRTKLITVAAPGFCLPGQLLEVQTMKQYVQIVVRDSGWRDHGLSYGVLDGARHWIVNDHLTKKQLIMAGMGWGKLQEHIIAEELADGRLIPLEITHYPCQVDMEIRAVRRLGEPLGPVAASLWKGFADAADI